MLLLDVFLYSRKKLFALFLSGGEPGSPGLNLLLKADGRIINLGGKASVNIKPGVSLCDDSVKSPANDDVGSQRFTVCGRPRTRELRNCRDLLMGHFFSLLV